VVAAIVTNFPLLDSSLHAVDTLLRGSQGRDRKRSHFISCLSFPAPQILESPSPPPPFFFFSPITLGAYAAEEITPPPLASPL